MPAYVHHRSETSRRDRAFALAAVGGIEMVVGLLLLSGLRVDLRPNADDVAKLISVTPRAPAPPPPEVHPKNAPKRASGSAARSKKISVPAHSIMPTTLTAPIPITPTVALHAVPVPQPGGSGASAGNGPGSGSGRGYGDGGDGTELVQIAGEIRPSDYPRNLREAGIGGRVGLSFIVGTDGRVTRCAVTSSSGVPQLDALTCRLIQERFRYRPSTDRYGRPMADEVDGEHEWIPRAR